MKIERLAAIEVAKMRDRREADAARVRAVEISVRDARRRAEQAFEEGIRIGSGDEFKYHMKHAVVRIAESYSPELRKAFDTFLGYAQRSGPSPLSAPKVRARLMPEGISTVEVRFEIPSSHFVVSFAAR